MPVPPAPDPSPQVMYFEDHASFRFEDRAHFEFVDHSTFRFEE